MHKAHFLPTAVLLACSACQPPNTFTNAEGFRITRHTELGVTAWAEPMDWGLHLILGTGKAGLGRGDHELRGFNISVRNDARRQPCVLSLESVRLVGPGGLALPALSRQELDGMLAGVSGNLEPLRRRSISLGVGEEAALLAVFLLPQGWSSGQHDLRFEVDLGPEAKLRVANTTMLIGNDRPAR